MHGSSYSPTHTQVSEMPNADEDALRAIRAASTALQEKWPEGESPRSWRFPVPEVAGVIGAWMGEQLKVLNELKEEAMESLSHQTIKDPELARTLLDKVDDYAANLASSALENVAPVSGEPLDERVAEPLKKSVEELNELLPAGWQQQHCLSK